MSIKEAIITLQAAQRIYNKIKRNYEKEKNSVSALERLNEEMLFLTFQVRRTILGKKNNLPEYKKLLRCLKLYIKVIERRIKALEESEESEESEEIEVIEGPAMKRPEEEVIEFFDEDIFYIPNVNAIF